MLLRSQLQVFNVFLFLHNAERRKRLLKDASVKSKSSNKLSVPVHTLLDFSLTAASFKRRFLIIRSGTHVMRPVRNEYAMCVVALRCASVARLRKSAAFVDD